MIIHHPIEQNTEAWHILRMDKFTASASDDLFKGKTTIGYNEAIDKIVHALITGERPNDFKGNKSTDRGHELEPKAIKSYENKTFRKVKPGGFYEYNKWIGCSPDGCVGEDGLIEAKCREWKAMHTYLRTNELLKKDNQQVQFQLFASGRKWVDFVAYHPELGTMIIRVYPDPVIQASLAKELGIAIAEVKKRVNQIQLTRGLPLMFV